MADMETVTIHGIEYNIVNVYEFPAAAGNPRKQLLLLKPGEHDKRVCVQYEDGSYSEVVFAPYTPADLEARRKGAQTQGNDMSEFKRWLEKNG